MSAEEAPQLRREKKVKVPAKVSLSTVTKLGIAETPGLAGAFAIAVTNGHHTFQITVHHPVGFTDLDDADWVATPSSDINSLLARADDASVKNVEKQRREAITAHLLDKKLLEKLPDGKIVYPGTKAVRNDRKAEVDHRFSEARKTALEQAKSEAAAAGRKFVENKWKPAFGRESFMDDQDAKFEEAIQKAIVAFKPDLEKKFPIKYRTYGGPLANRPQVSSGLPEGETLKAMDAAFRMIATSLRAVGPVVPTPPLGAPPGEEGAKGASAQDDKKKS